jgi:hypothetical protein
MELTQQEFFDKSVAGVLKQSVKSADAFKNCRYRAKEVGVYMKDWEMVL